MDGQMDGQTDQRCDNMPFATDVSLSHNKAI